MAHLSYLKLTTLKNAVWFLILLMFSFALEIQKPLDYLKNGSVSTSFHMIPTGFELAISPRQGE